MPCPIHCKILDKYEPPKSDFYWWSKAKLCRPKDNIKTEKCPRKKSFRPSFDCPKCEPNMTFLIKNEYNRMYDTEHAEFQKKIKGYEAAMSKQCKKLTLKCMNPQEKCPKPKFTMKRFNNIKAKVDTKGIDLRKNRTDNTSSPNQFCVASPGCYPNFCCRCPRCVKY